MNITNEALTDDSIDRIIRQLLTLKIEVENGEIDAALSRIESVQQRLDDTRREIQLIGCQIEPISRMD